MAEARGKTDKAAALYQSWGGPQNSSTLGVNLASRPHSEDKIRTYLKSARKKYKSYLDSREDTGRVRVELNRVRTLLDWVVIQTNLIRAHRTIAEQSTASLFTQQYGKFSNSLDEFGNYWQTANDRLENHKKRKQQMKMFIDEIEESEYDAKILQFETNLHSLNFTRSILTQQKGAVEWLVGVLQNYLDDKFNAKKAEQTIKLTSKIQTSLTNFCCATTLVDNLLKKLRVAMVATKTGLENLKRIAENQDKQSTYETKAKESFNSSALLTTSKGEVAQLVSEL